MFKEQIFTTETGEQELIPINDNHDVTVLIIGGLITDDLNLQITLDNPRRPGVLRVEVAIDVLSSNVIFLKTLEGPIQSVGLDIILNDSNNIRMQVLSAKM